MGLGQFSCPLFKAIHGEVCKPRQHRAHTLDSSQKWTGLVRTCDCSSGYPGGRGRKITRVQVEHQLKTMTMITTDQERSTLWGRSWFQLIFCYDFYLQMNFAFTWNLAPLVHDTITIIVFPACSTEEQNQRPSHVGGKALCHRMPFDFPPLRSQKLTPSSKKQLL